MSWGNCYVKVSSPHGDFHDEPEGVAPGRLGGGRVGGADQQPGRRGGPTYVASAVSATQGAVSRGGRAGLRHRGRGQLSHRRLPASKTVQVQALLSGLYKGFNDTHATEKLLEVEQIAISRESVRRLRRALGLPAVHRRRPPQHRSRRPREQAAGPHVQLDGSPFDWLQNRGPRQALLGAIDDATSQVVALHFRPTEALHGYAPLLH